MFYYYVLLNKKDKILRKFLFFLTYLMVFEQRSQSFLQSPQKNKTILELLENGKSILLENYINLI